MANLSQIQVGGTTYDICDTTARDSISQICEIESHNGNGTVLNSIQSLFIKTSPLERPALAISRIYADDVNILGLQNRIVTNDSLVLFAKDTPSQHSISNFVVLNSNSTFTLQTYATDTTEKSIKWYVDFIYLQ